MNTDIDAYNKNNRDTNENNRDTNEMKLSFLAKSENESFARLCVAAFAQSLDPIVSEIQDVKTAVSEAVTNAIIHGYEGVASSGFVDLNCCLIGRKLTITVSDSGIGIEDIEKAKEPLYTSKPDMERSGMGFTVMESFMDEVKISSELGRGTKIIMIKFFS